MNVTTVGFLAHNWSGLMINKTSLNQSPKVIAMNKWYEIPPRRFEPIADELISTVHGYTKEEGWWVVRKVAVGKDADYRARGTAIYEATKALMDEGCELTNPILSNYKQGKPGSAAVDGKEKSSHHGEAVDKSDEPSDPCQ